MKCKPYSEIIVEIGTQLRTVKITSNIYAVYIQSGPSMMCQDIIDGPGCNICNK